MHKEKYLYISNFYLKNIGFIIDHHEQSGKFSSRSNLSDHLGSV